MSTVGRFLFSTLVLPAIAVQAKETDIERDNRDAHQAVTTIPTDKLGLGTSGQAHVPAPAFASRRDLLANRGVTGGRQYSQFVGGDDERAYQDFLAFRAWQQGGAMGGAASGTPRQLSANGLRFRGQSMSRLQTPQQPNIIIVQQGNNNMQPSNLSVSNEPGQASQPSPHLQTFPSQVAQLEQQQAMGTDTGAYYPSTIAEEDSDVKKQFNTGQVGVDMPDPSPSPLHEEVERPPTPHSCNTVEQVKVVKVMEDGEVVNKMVTHNVTYTQDELYTAATQFYHRLIAEALGTWAITFWIAGLGIEAHLGHINQVGIAIGAGLVFVALIYSLGQVSGAHFNPVVTFAFVLRGMFPLLWLPFYWIVQFVGAIVAGAMLLGFYGGGNGDYGATIVPDTYTQQEGFLMETVLTFLLVFTILSMASRSKIVGPHAALAIGSVIALNIMLAGSYSGASMNPWRSVGISLVFPITFYSIWVYFAGPFLGSTIAVIFVFMLAGKPKDEELSAGIGASIAVAIGHVTSREAVEEEEPVK